MTAKEWLRSQVGVWQFNYTKQDVRDKKLHPATFPIELAERVISLFSHEGELVVDPFVGSGTTLLAARLLDRNAAGFDINPDYISLAKDRLSPKAFLGSSIQVPVLDDARNVSHYLHNSSVKLVFTSPPYANMLNRKRKNKSRRASHRLNEQYLKNEQYSQMDNDLGTLEVEPYEEQLTEIFALLYPKVKDKGHVVVNIGDMWWEGQRIPLHLSIIRALTKVGFEFRNTVVWDRTNIVNKLGIFGWPNNYITIGTTFEFILHFRKPEPQNTPNSL